jgi:hypothetical protein
MDPQIPDVIGLSSPKRFVEGSWTLALLGVQL